MSKFFNLLLRYVKRINTWVIFATSVFAIYASYNNLLFKKITLSVYLLAICILTPYLVYGVVRFFWLRQKRLFTTGNVVAIIADERKFVVIRYHYWFPLYTVCKEADKNNAIAVHQRYLQPYQEPEKNPLDFSNFIAPNINKLVPTYRIKRL